MWSPISTPEGQAEFSGYRNVRRASQIQRAECLFGGGFFAAEMLHSFESPID
jgi:hypothetical protein